MIKNAIIVLTFLALAFSCSRNDDNTEPELIGKYQLIEILADPGDGSGTFQSVSSDKTISFYNDSTVTSNGELCLMSIESNSPTSGSYSSADSSINSGNCMLTFELIEEELILTYQCIEACRAKFLKL
jgi:hypothetical protein